MSKHAEFSNSLENNPPTPSQPVLISVDDGEGGDLDLKEVIVLEKMDNPIQDVWVIITCRESEVRKYYCLDTKNYMQQYGHRITMGGNCKDHALSRVGVLIFKGKRGEEEIDVAVFRNPETWQF